MAETEEAVQTITISGVPEDLIEKIDALAAKEDRTRSNFIRRLLERLVDDKKKTQLVGAR